MDRPIWIDTDAGIDDALAIMIASAHGTLVGISCTHGNSPCRNVVVNVRRVLSAIKATHPDFVVPPVCISAETSEQPLDIGSSHGKDGLGDIPEVDAQLDIPQLNYEIHDFISTYSKISSKYPNLTTIFIGPLTSAAKLLRSGAKISNFVLMGCSIPELFLNFPERSSGNALPFAEFNIACDPKSAKLVFEQQPKMKIVDWCLTLKYLMDSKVLLELHGDNKLANFHKAIMSFIGSSVWICDPLAIMVACGLDHEVIQASISINDDQGDEHFGQSYVDPKKPNPYDVVTSVDIEMVKKMIRETMK